MKSMTLFAGLLSCTFLSASDTSDSSAGVPWGFPLERKFVLIVLNDDHLGYLEQYGIKSPVLSIKRDLREDKFSGAGTMSCNDWAGDIKLGQNDFLASNLRMTAMLCGAETAMKVDRRFLAALRGVKKWRIDGSWLILEGDAVRLMLLPAKRTE